MENPVTYCSRKHLAAVHACVLGRDVWGGGGGQAREGFCLWGFAVRQGSWWRWWQGETLQVNMAKPCSHIHPFPGETGSLLAAQREKKREEKGLEEGWGKFCTLVELTCPPGLSLSLFSRRKEISLCPQPGPENILVIF